MTDVAEIGTRRIPTALLGPAATAGAAVAALAVLLRYDPHAGIPWLPICPFKAMTGLDCPGCGGTRATWDLMHLDFGRAMQDNAMVFVILPALALGWLAWVRRATTGRPARHMPRWLPIVAVCLAVSWTVLRNSVL